MEARNSTHRQEVAREQLEYLLEHAPDDVCPIKKVGIRSPFACPECRRLVKALELLVVPMQW